MDLTKFLRVTRKFRMTILGVIITIGMSVFLLNFVSIDNPINPLLIQLNGIIALIFIFNLAFLFIPVIYAYYHSDKFSEDLIAKDRMIILDDF